MCQDFSLKLLEIDYSSLKKKKRFLKINSLNKRASSRAVVIISFGELDMTVLIFSWSPLDLSLVQLTNIFMSDSYLPQCSDSTLIAAGQDKAYQLPVVSDVVVRI